MVKRTVLLAAVASLALAAGSAQVAQADVTLSATSLDSYDPGSTGASTSAPTGTLTNGRFYLIGVKGTFSAFEPKLWAGFDSFVVCGTPEPAPIFPTPAKANGPVGTDAETEFARPWRNNCPPTEMYPQHYPNFQMNLGSGWAHREPVFGQRSTPTPGHGYLYLVKGEGKPAQFRIVDTETADNYGKLGIVLLRLGPSDCYGDGWKANGFWKSQSSCRKYFDSDGTSDSSLMSRQTNEAPMQMSPR